MNTHKTIGTIFLSLISISSAATTLLEDFEGVTIPALPTGWQAVGTGVTTAANGSTGNASNSAAGSTNYLVNSGLAFDATQSITGTFDFYIGENGNYSNGAFYIGDVQDGLTATSAGEFLRVDLRERTFGSRANILDGSGTTVFNGAGNNNYRIDTNNWYDASFTWTPTSGTTGDFSFSWQGRPGAPDTGAKGPMTVTGYTFDSANVFFGFGTQDDPARFDNISITGTIPEPSSTALIGLGGLALILRRRK